MLKVLGSRERLDRALSNLLDDALRHGCDRPGRTVRVGLRVVEGEPGVFVSDDGPGIPEAFHERTYGIFQRLHTEVDGTGVGLPIVRRVAELHGGRAWVESTPGFECTFWVSPPRCDLGRRLARR